MAGSYRGDDYLKQFLMYEFLDPRYPDQRGQLGPITNEKRLSRPHRKKGYAFVEFLAPNGSRLRCRPDWSQDHPNWVDGQHRCEPVGDSLTPYALDFEDIVAPADRQFWVAGTRLKVVDKRTGEIMASLTKFVWDPGFGGSTTGRWPWQHADNYGPSRNCPSEAGVAADISRKFVDTILITKQGD